MTSGRPPVPTRPLLVWVALVTVYLVWGSTYLAIRVVVETRRRCWRWARGSSPPGCCSAAIPASYAAAGPPSP